MPALDEAMALHDTPPFFIILFPALLTLFGTAVAYFLIQLWRVRSIFKELQNRNLVNHPIHRSKQMVDLFWCMDQYSQCLLTTWSGVIYSPWNRPSMVFPRMLTLATCLVKSRGSFLGCIIWTSGHSVLHFSWWPQRQQQLKQPSIPKPLWIGHLRYRIGSCLSRVAQPYSTCLRPNGSLGELFLILDSVIHISPALFHRL